MATEVYRYSKSLLISLIMLIAVVGIFMQPAFSAYPRCESGCTANDIVWVKAKMVESTLQPGYYDVLLDVQFNANAPRYRTLAVFDICQVNRMYLQYRLQAGMRYINASIVPSKIATGLAKDLLLTSFSPEAGVRYVISDLYFAWDVDLDVTGCSLQRWASCVVAIKILNARMILASFHICPAPVLDTITSPSKMCAGETKKLDLTVSGDSGSMGYTYEWTPSTYLDNPAIEDPTVWSRASWNLHNLV